jgi:hypothetical protein
LFGAVTFSRVICFALVLIFCGVYSVKAKEESKDTAGLATKILTDRIGDFEARSSATQVNLTPPGELLPAAFDITARAGRDYFAKDGKRFIVYIATTRSESAAYSLLTYSVTNAAHANEAKPVPIGTVGTVVGNTIYFFKGSASALISITDPGGLNEGLELARILASSLDKGEDDIPALVKHLPSWQTVRPTYAVSLETLQAIVPGQPIIKELSFEGGTEAVVANYGQAQLIIAEFTTPQFSVDNDQRILARIQELKSQGQAVPSAYRRVGNYSVFVFNAPDEKTANELIDQVKYQQVVQWLGDDPHLAARLQRYISQTTAGVLTAVLKSSGLSLLLCLGLGGLIGTLLFRHRRARKATLYSDAGGATRLNLDELTGAGNSHTLLRPANQPESDSTKLLTKKSR